MKKISIIMCILMVFININALNHYKIDKRFYDSKVLVDYKKLNKNKYNISVVNNKLVVNNKSKYKIVTIELSKLKITDDFGTSQTFDKIKIRHGILPLSCDTLSFKDIIKNQKNLTTFYNKKKIKFSYSYDNYGLKTSKYEKDIYINDYKEDITSFMNGITNNDLYSFKIIGNVKVIYNSNKNIYKEYKKVYDIVNAYDYDSLENYQNIDVCDETKERFDSFFKSDVNNIKYIQVEYKDTTNYVVLYEDMKKYNDSIVKINEKRLIEELKLDSIRLFKRDSIRFDEQSNRISSMRIHNLELLKIKQNENKKQNTLDSLLIIENNKELKYYSTIHGNTMCMSSFSTNECLETGYTILQGISYGSKGIVFGFNQDFYTYSKEFRNSYIFGYFYKNYKSIKSHSFLVSIEERPIIINDNYENKVDKIGFGYNLTVKMISTGIIFTNDNIKINIGLSIY